MTIEKLNTLYNSVRETTLLGRYITNEHIEPLLKKYSSNFNIEVIGNSVESRSIFGIKVGKGKTKVLLWSQMHGNESTTTKALFDIFNLFITQNGLSETILDALTLYVIPILNPDGAERYTRLNANDIDLNRDAQALSQPESKVLRQCFDTFQPDFCFNLHGQRTIFGVNKQSAVLSFLAPAQDEECSISENRKKSMALISDINKMLQSEIPNSIGLYDDSFNINCVGDTFQSLGVPTVLFEAGHYPNDYNREETRRLIFMSIITGLDIISKNKMSDYKTYFDIPKNEKSFYDVVIRNAKLSDVDMGLTTIAIQFNEVLKERKIVFIPKIEKITDSDDFFGHREIDARSNVVLSNVKKTLNVGNEIDFVFINNEKILVKSQ